MPGHMKRALQQFNHSYPKKQQDSPYPCAPIKYGAKIQYGKTPVDAQSVGAAYKKFTQQVCGKFLFYGMAVDNIILTALSAVASQQANPTTDTMAKAKQLLYYLASQEEAILTYSASNMVLAVHSDADYLNKIETKSRAGDHFFWSSNATIPANNGVILNVAQIINNVMSSAAEAELRAIYIMAREAVNIRHILKEIGLKQPASSIQTNNLTVKGVINSKITPKQTKAMNMQFYWLRDRETQEQFWFFWWAGKLNLADYWTKHHPAMHRRNVRNKFLTQKKVLNEFPLRIAKGESVMCI